MPTNVNQDNGGSYLAHFFELCFTSKVTSIAFLVKMTDQIQLYFRVLKNIYEIRNVK